MQTHILLIIKSYSLFIAVIDFLLIKKDRRGVLKLLRLREGEFSVAFSTEENVGFFVFIVNDYIQVY